MHNGENARVPEMHLKPNCLLNIYMYSADRGRFAGLGSVDELSRDLLQGAEGLLKLEALGDGLLLGGQRPLLRGGGGGLAALAQGVGSHDYQFLRHRAFPAPLRVLLLLLSCGRAAGGFGAAAGATGGARCLLLLGREDLLRRLCVSRL